MEPTPLPVRARSGPLALWLIFGFSVLTHLYGITHPLLDFHGWAQTLRASIARNYAEGGMKFFRPQVDFSGPGLRPAATQFPLYSYLIAVLYRGFGENEAWGRVLSALFAGGAAVFVALIAGIFLEETEPFWAGIFFSCFPLSIYFLRAVLPESLALCALTGGYYFWITGLRPEPSGSGLRSGGTSRVAAGIAGIVLAGLLKIPYGIFALPAAGWAFFDDSIPLPKRRRALAALGLALFFCVGGWYLYTLSCEQVLVNERGFLRGEVDVFHQWADPGFWSTVFVSRFPELVTTYAGLFFFFLGFAVLRGPKFRFLHVWLGTALLYLILCGRYARVHQYALVPLTGVGAVWIAAGFGWAWRRWSGKGARAGLILLALSIPVHGALRVRHWYRLDDLWVLRARESVARLSKPEDLFYINSQNQPFYLYHIRRKGWVGHLEGEGWQKLDRAIAQGARFLLSPRFVETLPHPGWKEELDRRYRKVVDDPDFLIYELKPGGRA